MKEIFKKTSNILKKIFGYGILCCLFVGALTFFGYVIAVIVGGETAETICTIIYKGIFPVLIYCSSILVLVGLVAMYLAGEVALTVKNNK